MINTIQPELLKRVAAFNGIEIYNVRTDKFKTNSINIFFHDNLCRENATKNALIPAILRRGCEKYPTFKDIALHLEEMYGSSFDCGIAKKGECQLIHFYIEFIADTYLEEGAELFSKALDLLTDIITKPIVENGCFKKEYLDQEKENLKNLIEGRVNDKMQYSVDRCFEEMCKDEAFGVYEYGTIADLDKIGAKDLFEYYKKIIETLHISVFITGDVDEEKLNKTVKILSSFRRSNTKELKQTESQKEITEIKEVEEKMDVNQGKLSLGFRTSTTSQENDYYALMLYNSILGGGMHSKLFQNVREKESLAYYVFSRLDKFKGLMIISGGIESENREKAQNIILDQMEELKNGNISDYEYESAIKNLETGIKSIKDNQLQIMDFYLSQVVTKNEDNLDSLIEKIKAVSKEDIIRITKKIKLDTIYFLTKKAESEG